MTEEEWMAATNTTPMWWHIEADIEKSSKRKFRLVACACCRSVSNLLRDSACKLLVETSEMLADGLISEEQADQVRDNFRKVAGLQSGDDFSVAWSALSSHPAVIRAVPSFAARLKEVSGESRAEEALIQSMIMRDIFGNPFRPIEINPRWLTSTTIGLAQAIYETRSFHNMPILADALQDAECDNESLLSHCRSGGEHYRGCFVLDAILNKQ